MANKIKILIVEDNLYDAELNLEILKKESWQIEHRITDNEKDYRKGLSSFNPDIILSDYHLPQFNGMDALRIASEKKPLTPFIIVTGSLDEEAAVDCIKKGAWDYVLKEHLNRLGPAVKFALDHKKERESNDNAEDSVLKKYAREALKESQERLSLALDATSEGIWDWDTVTNEIYFSDRFFSMLEYDPGDFKHDYNVLPELLHQEDKERVLENFKKALENKDEMVEEEYRMKNKNGGYTWILSRGKIAGKDKYGNIIRMVGTHVDISMRKRQENIQNVLYEIANSVNSTGSLVELFEFIRETLGTVIDTRNCYVALYDSKTDTLTLPFLRDEKDSFTEFPAGKTLTAYVIKKERAQLVNSEEVEELEKSGAVESVGSPSVSWLGVPLRIENKIIGVFVVQSYEEGMEYTPNDVHLLEFVSDQIALAIQRKQDQDKLRMNEERLRRIIESSPDGLVVIDTMGVILNFNSNFPVLLHTSPENLKNASFFDFVTAMDVIKAQNVLHDTLIEGYQKNIKFKMRRMDKTEFYAESSLGVIHGKENEVESFVIIVKNIDERIIYEENLKKAKEQAEEADRLKTAFLSNMSHEIRTPMNAIIGFAELLTNTEVNDEERKEFVKQINLGADSLMGLIDDIIDVAKIESGQLQLNEKSFNLARLFKELNVFFTKELIRRNKMNIELIVDHLNHSPEQNIIADELRLRQVFSNLLSNAIKFTDRGSISFGISEIINGKIVFFVKDTGIGIKEDKLNVIFERFIQGVEDKTKFYGGTGLGLAISKNLVELMGGDIKVFSSPGKGSLFTFSIPFQVIAKEKMDVEIAGGLIPGQWKDRKFLIVEDNDSNFLLLQEIIKPSMANIIWAKDGEEALKEFREHNDLDLVLLDMQIPKISGYDVTLEIKKDRPELPVIAQTAYALSEEKQKSINAGCDEYIAKPIKINHLIKILTKFLEKSK